MAVHIKRYNFFIFHPDKLKLFFYPPSKKNTNTTGCLFHLLLVAVVSGKIHPGWSRFVLDTHSCYPIKKWPATVFLGSCLGTRWLFDANFGPFFIGLIAGGLFPLLGRGNFFSPANIIAYWRDMIIGPP
jgi:hypothetical protein